MGFLLNIILSVVASAAMLFGLYNYAPLSALTVNQAPKVGSTITTINGSDTISGSRTTINTNFANLNATKFELSDWYATTSAAQITTLSNLVTVGTITSGTWNATAIGVGLGGTGTTSPTSKQIMFGNGASGFQVIGFGNSGQLLTSGGSGALPSWSSPSIDTSIAYTWTGLHTFSSSGLIITASSTANVGTLHIGNRTVPTPYLGGTGVDGALSISSGTTTITLTGAVTEKDYTSISITGTGSLNFTASTTATGNIVVLRSQGACTFTSSSLTMIDLRWLGGGMASAFPTFVVGTPNGAGGGGGGSTGGQGADGSGTILSSVNGTLAGRGGVALPALASSTRTVIAGGNGTPGVSSGGAGGSGGLGGGGIYIECAGAYTFTTGGFNASGSVGSAATGNSGGGGGSGGGNILVQAGSISADTGTYNVSAGSASGAAGAGASGGSGANGTHLEAVNSYYY